MKYLVTFIILFAVLTGCKPKVISGAELENKLKETMKDYLIKTLLPGTEVTVKDIGYYPDKSTKTYNCEFNVNLRTANKDTTGQMSATITNDFTKVVRTR